MCFGYTACRIKLCTIFLVTNYSATIRRLLCHSLVRLVILFGNVRPGCFSLHGFMRRVV